MPTRDAPLLGIDLGGSAIKSAAVDTARGRVRGEVRTLPTPHLATPAAISVALQTVVAACPECRGPIGFAFPAVIKNGHVLTAAHIDQGWIGIDAGALASAATGRATLLINDADAAGIAEMRVGAGRGERGTVLALTLGTGIGSALFVEGRLWPNTELGHLEVNAAEAEEQASAKVRSSLHLGWAEWCQRVNRVLAAYERLLWPDLIIISGGVTEHWTEFGHLLVSKARLTPAALREHAGVVGAALCAAEWRAPA
jgi:polyphosphate glucokinase